MPQRDISEFRRDLSGDQSPLRLGFLLVDDFALMSYASVIEPFRAANHLSGRALYVWNHYSPSSQAVRASNGLRIEVDGSVRAIGACDILFVCAGGNPALFDDKPSLDVLRRLAARGCVLGGVSGGPYILARAGLLNGYRCTIHWEHEPSLRELYPDVITEQGIYCIDRRRVTCAGGAAGLDLAIALIRRAHGPDLSQQVSDWFIRTQERDAAGAQRASVAERYRVHHKGLIAALTAMQANISNPLSRDEVAAIAGVSVRHIERLFRTRLGMSLREHEMTLRLQLAMRLLRETGLSRTEIAVACGFISVSHFSRAFIKQFALSPSQVRRAA